MEICVSDAVTPGFPDCLTKQVPIGPDSILYALISQGPLGCCLSQLTVTTSISSNAQLQA